MITLAGFVESDLSLLVYADGKPVFESRASDLTPLLGYIDHQFDYRDELTLYDRYVGRAAALLMTIIRPTTVYCKIISDGGADVLNQYGIPFQSDQQVKFLMGVASGEMCRFEKMARNKSAEEFLRLLKKENANQLM